MPSCERGEAAAGAPLAQQHAVPLATLPAHKPAPSLTVQATGAPALLEWDVVLYQASDGCTAVGRVSEVGGLLRCAQLPPYRESASPPHRKHTGQCQHGPMPLIAHLSLASRLVQLQAQSARIERLEEEGEGLWAVTDRVDEVALAGISQVRLWLCSPGLAGSPATAGSSCSSTTNSSSHRHLYEKPSHCLSPIVLLALAALQVLQADYMQLCDADRVSNPHGEHAHEAFRIADLLPPGIWGAAAAAQRE